MTALLSVFALTAGIFAAPPVPSAPALCAGAPALMALAAFEGGEGGEGGTIQATCTADCYPFTDVSCTAATCSAANRSCPEEQGHVTCGTTTYYCPACGTPECTEGSFKTVTTGPTCGCEDGASTPKDRYQCINGQWEYLYSFCGAPFCPIYP